MVGTDALLRAPPIAVFATVILLLVAEAIHKGWAPERTSGLGTCGPS